jgi:hypothetical protein
VRARALRNLDTDGLAIDYSVRWIGEFNQYAMGSPCQALDDQRLAASVEPNAKARHRR